ncbi:MAG: IS1182 family transposase [Bacteroidales bacterium]|nr:IS1182 family transposase [Bacteroidales bacterium]
MVDAFVDAIDLKSFGFAHVECHEEGRPPYHPSILLKLYLYGYRYGIRTTRKLEREAQTNIEAMWLLTGLRPKYKTIADFRKNHSKAFREVFRRFVCLLKDWKLIDGQTVAIDSFKIRGNNSLKNNFNDKKLSHHLAYIDAQISEYEALLDVADKQEDKKGIEEKLKERKEKQTKYTQVKKDLEESGEEQISLTDPDSRAVILLRNIVNVGYNIQSSSDSKHKFLVEYDTGHVNDTNALANIAIDTKELLGVEHLNALADKGYHTGAELSKCRENGITTFVSPKAPATRDIGLYPITSFIYDHKNDLIQCPQGHEMRTNNTWHQHSDKRKGKKGAYRFRRYNTPACKTCISRHLCTQSKNGRYIDRSEYANVTEENAKRIYENPEYYRLRQQITEHMFGTLKRQRGFTFTLVRGKENVLGEVGLMFIGYNLSRCISVLGAEKLIKALRKSCLLGFADKILLLLSQFKKSFSLSIKTIPVRMGSFYFIKGSLLNPKELYLCVN